MRAEDWNDLPACIDTIEILHAHKKDGQYSERSLNFFCLFRGWYLLSLPVCCTPLRILDIKSKDSTSDFRAEGWQSLSALLY